MGETVGAGTGIGIPDSADRESSEITSGRNFEFTKHFVKAAQKQFLTLEGFAIEVCKFVVEFEGTASCLAWHTDNSGLVTILEDAFEKTFCQLFVDLGLGVYYAYELSLKNIYLKDIAPQNYPSSSSSSSSTPSTSSQGNSDSAHDNLGAIQVLATYAGSTCFDHMIQTGTTEDLLKALTAEKYWWKWSTWTKFRTKENLYFLMPNEGEEGQGMAESSKLISPSDFFLRPVPVFANDFSNKQKQMRTNRMRKIKSLQFLPKQRGSFNFELEPLHENEKENEIQMQNRNQNRKLSQPMCNQSISTAHQPASVRDFVRRVKPVRTTIAEQICKSLLRDKSFSWNETSWRNSSNSLISAGAGNINQSSLASKHNIVKILKHQRKFKEAYEMSSEILEVQKRVMGNSHPYTLKTKCSMASLLESQGMYKEALDLYSKVLKVQGKLLGPSHPDTLKLKLNMEGAEEQEALKVLAEEGEGEEKEAEDTIESLEKPSTNFNSLQARLKSKQIKKGNSSKRNTIM